MRRTESSVAAIAHLHAEVDREARRLTLVHEARLRCGRGCSGCCVDDLTVFEVEAARIRGAHAALLATGVPHAEGACAFLDDEGACRIYAERPYVCRTQGLPLRWIEERDDDADAAGDAAPGALVELRDICELNEDGEPLEELPEEACWTLGPFEARLAELQIAAGHGAERTRLRDLFASSRRESK